MLDQRRLNNRESGFTIVELIVVMIVSGIILGAASVIIASHTRLTQRTRYLIVANAFVEKKVESLRSAGFSTLSDGTIDFTGDMPGELKNPRNAALVISSHTPAVKAVQISVTYNEQGVPRTYQYTTYIGELGVGQ